jgi:hypothetical protein
MVVIAREIWVAAAVVPVVLVAMLDLPEMVVLVVLQ